MNRFSYFSIFFVIIFITNQLFQFSSAVEVTNQQLRDGLISLVHSYSSLENKLERHEQRERALGDVIKRALQTLQKGQKIFEPMRGTFERLDERMSQMETVLIAQDEKFMDHQIKIGTALEAIMKWIMDTKNNGEGVISVGVKSNTVDHKNANNNDEDNKNLQKDVTELSENVKGLRRQITELINEKNTVAEQSKGLLEQTEKLVKSKLTSADEVISKMEHKLTNFYITAPAITTTNSPPIPPRNLEWELNVLKSLDDIKLNIDGIRNVDLMRTTTTITPTTTTDRTTIGNVYEMAPSILPLVDREYFGTMTNETLESIRDMRLEVLTASDKSFTKTAARIKDSADRLDNSINEVLKTITDSTSTPENFYEDVNKNLLSIRSDIDGLSKMENILVESGNNILAMKRGMEFNVHTIKVEVGEMITNVGKQLNETLNQRFNAINETILSNHKGALSNLTTKIETEISQVWRQIGIMYQEVSSSKDAVNKLQELTEAYVNGTFTTMDSMEGKVSQITDRMHEVDSNLNYLLGRLSLVTQEFNNIKSGLGNALDQIRSSFQIVQNKIEDVGPGPHKIPPEEHELEQNLLPKSKAN